MNPDDCAPFREALYGDLLVSDLDEHLATCADCQRLARRLQRIDIVIKATPIPEPRPELLDEIRAATSGAPRTSDPDEPEDWVVALEGNHEPSAEVRTFADRLRWIVDADYADEGTSARLPLLALADALDASEHTLRRHWWLLRLLRAPRRLRQALDTLNRLR
jgi:hypothetical protein